MKPIVKRFLKLLKEAEELEELALETASEDGAEIYSSMLIVTATMRRCAKKLENQSPSSND
ncbi:hypothetical protein H6G81_15625 [Scytonema hofmannii FACHB-248]|uniref:Uncharacterized protein n=1 Tax=Scytonema hofmannii FACHB-248 TaxID=1842502 RepID=A0ABR8GR33_9CYAN|nr:MULTISPECIES: hypothetical protein [Nostocales]MBD2605910.1 hypothetical protein [Scytonema hofmannii FACHB-248]